MAIKRVKVKEHEKLSDSNIEHVISLLEADKPVTKKVACEILNISYNTTRLNTIIENFKKRKEYEAKRKSDNKGKPATEDEIECVVKEYLNGRNISEISKDMFRSASFVKSILDKLGVPQKATGDAKYVVGILPDQCVKEEFEEGEVVWSSRYHSPCQVTKEILGDKYVDKYGCKVYRIYIMKPLSEEIPGFHNVTFGGFFASSPAYDLGSLQHLKKYKVKFDA